MYHTLRSTFTQLLTDGHSVIAALYEEGIYRSQFETKISNGGLTAFASGDRDTWEETMLGGAYQALGVTEAELRQNVLSRGG